MPNWLRTGLAALLVVLTPLLAHAQAPRPVQLELIVFPGGYNWPTWAAEETGAFARRGLSVHVTETPNSVFLMTGLIDGRFDLAFTAFDNIVAYDEGQGAAPTTAKPELIAVMGGDNGLLHLIAEPGVTRVSDLRGKTVSVDAKTTGYAFVLYKLLQKGGLRATDYDVASAGGTAQRYDALMRHEQSATLLAPPYDLQAVAKGYRDLGGAAGALGPYQGLTLAARRGWARAHAAALEAFVQAYVEGLKWLREPKNHAAAVALLRRHAPGMSADTAEAAARVMLDPKSGLAPDAALDPAGLEQVLSLRNEFGRPPRPLTDAKAFYDLTYYDQAMRGGAQRTGH
jgi:ABC-type nitrate/sulfonate/bicarbonate transport system substrate-binding protein